MRFRLLLAAIASPFLASLAASEDPKKPAAPPVLVELFTSQG